MKRSEVYDHLAQVYLGKSNKVEEKKKKRQFSVWLVINFLITVVIFSSAFYGLSAFLTNKDSYLKNQIIVPLHNGLIQVPYNFNGDVSPQKIFNLSVPVMDTEKFNALKFSIRAKEEGNPGIIKVVIKNQKAEVSSYYIRDIEDKWKEHSIFLSEFDEITDWTKLKDVSFVLESWNVDKKKGLILIEDVSFCTVN